MIGTTSLPAPNRRLRRVKNGSFTVFLWGCAVIALAPLVVITTYVVGRGVSALSVSFFTRTPAGPLDPASGGVAQAFVGWCTVI